ncbi:MAG: TolC family protein [Candidatus Eisenbacteria bacterium]|nr:TolC family protein [Candidatus Eisenbacteria bacterium]
MRYAHHSLLGALCFLLTAASLAAAAAGGEWNEEWRAATAADLNTAPTLPDLSSDPDLRDYLTYAALNNPRLEAAFLEWKATGARIPQVTALPDPQLSYAYYIREVETRVGPQEHRLSVSQKIPWFGKLSLKGKAASEAAAAARARYEARKLDLFHEVTAAYYVYAYLARAVEIARENLLLWGDLESVARIKYAAGSVPHSVVIQAQVELGKQEDNLQTLEGRREPVVARLNASLNRPSHEPLPWPAEIQVDSLIIGESELHERLRERNPELLALENTVDQAEHGIALAKKQRYPDIILGGGYIFTGEALNPELNESGKDPITASISINLPIWFGKYAAAEREARARRLSASRRHRQLGNRLESRLETALYNYEDAERKADLYGNTLIPKGRQALRVTRQAFEAGDATFINFIDAQRTLLEFELAYERARANQATYLSELETLTGGPLTNEETRRN